MPHTPARASHKDDVLQRNVVLAALLTFQKSGSTVVQHFAWFMHDSCPCLLWRIDISASLLSVFNRQPTGGLFIFDDQLIFCPPGCLYMRARVLCCPALHHLPVPDNHDRWCVLHLRTAAWGWLAVQVSSHLQAEHADQLGCSGGVGGVAHPHTSRGNFSIVLWIVKEKCLFLVLRPGLCCKLLKLWLHKWPRSPQYLLHLWIKTHWTQSQGNQHSSQGWRDM